MSVKTMNKSEIEAVKTINAELRRRLKEAAQLLKQRKANEEKLRVEIDEKAKAIAATDSRIEKLESAVETSKEAVEKARTLAEEKRELEGELGRLHAEVESLKKQTASPDLSEIYGIDGSPEFQELSDAKDRLEEELDIAKRELERQRAMSLASEKRADDRAAEQQSVIRQLKDALAAKDQANEMLTQKLRRAVLGQDDEMANQIILASMHASGTHAQIVALRNEHPESPLLKETDYTFEDGRKKTKLRVIYEDAWDQKGIELGIDDPKELREA